MTMSASIAWEFRDSATANMVNGGGFKAGASGVDYSTGDAAVTAWSKTDGTSNASTTFTSAAATFDANIVGNVLHLISGTNGTAGWYEVTAYTDANTITLDRNCSTGAMTNGVFNVGGALNVGGSLEDDFFEEISGANSTDGMKVWIKNGSYTISEAVSTAGAGGSQIPIVIEGYNTTRGDVPTGANRPTITQGANAFTVGTNFDVYNIIFTGTAATEFTAGANSKIVNCKFTNTSTTTGRDAFAAGNDNLVFNNEMVSYRGRALKTGAVYGAFIDNYLHDSDVGIGSGNTTGQHYIQGNIIADNVTASVRYTAAFTNLIYLKNNTIYGAENKLGIGVSLATGVTDVWLIGNILYGFVTGVSHADAAQTVGFDNYNDYNNNTTDVTNWTKGANDVTTSPPDSTPWQTQLTGINATSSTNVLTGASGTPFSTVTAGVDCVYLSAGTGTGIALTKYGITSVNGGGVSITLDSNITSSGSGSAISWQITTTHNFAIGTNLKALGFPGAFQGSMTTGYIDIGAAQRQESSSIIISL